MKLSHALLLGFRVAVISFADVASAADFNVKCSTRYARKAVPFGAINGPSVEFNFGSNSMGSEASPHVAAMKTGRDSVVQYYVTVTEDFDTSVSLFLGKEPGSHEVQRTQTLYGVLSTRHSLALDMNDVSGKTPDGIEFEGFSVECKLKQI